MKKSCRSLFISAHVSTAILPRHLHSSPATQSLVAHPGPFASSDVSLEPRPLQQINHAPNRTKSAQSDLQDPYIRDLSPTVALLSQSHPEPATISNADLRRTQSFFLAHSSHLHFAAPNFRQVPVSPYPEVCFLGRSNVGKSSLINALLDTPKLAVTSSKPGRTRMINGFLFGPVCAGTNMGVKVKGTFNPPSQKAVRKSGLGKARESLARAKRLSEETQTSDTERPFEAQYNSDGSRRGIVLVDMPGYGFGSWKTQGVEIMKYVQKREQLRHTFVLINGLHGLKDTDKDLISTLQEAQAPFSLVLTKGDTAKGGRAGLLKLLEETKANYDVDVWPTTTHGQLQGLDELRFAILQETRRVKLPIAG